MKKLLNTLYVTTQGSYLSQSGETVLIRVEKETKLRVPIHTLDSIICFGQVSCSPPLMQLCAERNVTISFLSYYGKFQARVVGPVSGNVLLRREQYRQADDEDKSVSIAKSIVLAKISNCRTVLQRGLRSQSSINEKSKIENAVSILKFIIDKVYKSDSLKILRGYEGEAARKYFEVFDNLIIVQKKDFYFKERTRRPPLDNMNALLSFLYTLCVHDLTSSLESVGLDPAVGFFHQDRPGRPGLALDLVEEFRPYLADRLALTLVNRQQIKGNGFKKTESGGVIMDDKTRKEVLTAYQKRKYDEIQHPFLNEKISVGLLPYSQTLLLSRYLRGDIDGYPPFFWR